MNTNTGKQLKEFNEGVVLNHLDAENGKSILEIAQFSYLGFNSVKSAVQRLRVAGLLNRTWDGNERFGRYLYKRI